MVIINFKFVFSALAKYDVYIIDYPDSIFAQKIISKEDLLVLSQTTYDFKNAICNVYMEK